MTTSETMCFYADIILPKTWSKADRRARVVEVLAAMGLKHKQRTMVGGTLPGGLMLRGLSGGERKRLSIAAGILAAPSIVYLDEPTSGLDSFAALTVMGYLKRMARDNGHVVIASIHQPRSAIWSMFDKVRTEDSQPSTGSRSSTSAQACSTGKELRTCNTAKATVACQQHRRSSHRQKQQACSPSMAAQISSSNDNMKIPQKEYMLAGYASGGSSLNCPLLCVLVGDAAGQWAPHVPWRAR
jgi:ABC-type multidrug transport system ATPase subunit